MGGISAKGKSKKATSSIAGDRDVLLNQTHLPYVSLVLGRYLARKKLSLPTEVMHLIMEFLCALMPSHALTESVSQHRSPETISIADFEAKKFVMRKDQFNKDFPATLQFGYNSARDTFQMNGGCIGSEFCENTVQQNLMRHNSNDVDGWEMAYVRAANDSAIGYGVVPFDFSDVGLPKKMIAKVGLKAIWSLGVVTRISSEGYQIEWRQGQRADNGIDFTPVLPMRHEYLRLKTHALFFRMLIEPRTYAEVFYQESYGGCTSQLAMTLEFSLFG